MQTLWVSAHPDPRSLTASLRTDAIATLVGCGHDVVESDLYAMGWNPVVGRDDFPRFPPDDRLLIGPASGQAFESGTLSADILAEQRKIDDADLLVLQFPLWWYGVPAMLKGWIDRVFVMGFGYPFNHPDRPRDSARYGEGRLHGKRALLVVTSGSSEESLGPRGIHGPMDEILFPVQHGTLFYAGATVLPPFVTYLADWLDADGYREVADRLADRLRGLADEQPIPYRAQRGGDYTRTLSLRPDILPSRSGSEIHSRDAA